MVSLESHLVERKSLWKNDKEDICKAICAFANDLPDSGQIGILFVGVDDCGKPTNLDINDEMLQAMADVRRNGKILPLPVMEVEVRILGGAKVAVIAVHPSDSPPIRYDGRIWIRTGSTKAIASAQDERILNERRRHHDIPYDLRAVEGTTVEDLSRLYFEQEYLPQAFAIDVLEANQRSYLERLASLRMIESMERPIPTLTGLLVLGKSPQDFLPQAKVEFLKIEGTDLADPVVDNLQFSGNLATLFLEMDTKLQSHLRSTVHFATTHQEIRTSDYPLAALQQLCRNAVLHRTYEGTNASVRVYWFEERIEIHSPGGPFGIVNKDNFGRPGIADYRNLHLAEAAKVLGYVQKFGAGIATARRELERNGNPEPEFEIQPTMVMVTLRRRV